MEHIKRDGSWLCNADRETSKTMFKLLYRYDSHISFNDAHTYDLTHKLFCKKCVKKYYELLDKAPYIIVDGKPQKQD